MVAESVDVGLPDRSEISVGDGADHQPGRQGTVAHVAEGGAHHRRREPVGPEPAVDQQRVPGAANGDHLAQSLEVVDVSRSVGGRPGDGPVEHRHVEAGDSRQRLTGQPVVAVPALDIGPGRAGVADDCT
jgi:hypothetical protein